MPSEFEISLAELNAKLAAELDRYPVLVFDDVATALDNVRNQYLNSQPLVWTGPDKLHPSISATNFPPSWHFSEEGMASHADRDRDFWDVYTLVAFQLGFHNGTVNESIQTLHYKKLMGIYDLVSKTTPPPEDN